MANLLAHCLSAMALQSLVNPMLGLGYVSESSFLAGILGMLIHLDRDRYNAGRTPYLHSVTFCILYSLVGVGGILLILEYGILIWAHAAVFLTIVPTGFSSHLAIDFFTKEGIFICPRSLAPTNWFQRRPGQENTWVNWNKFSGSSNRSNDDPVLNLCASTMSLVVLIVLLALTPL